MAEKTTCKPMNVPANVGFLVGQREQNPVISSGVHENNERSTAAHNQWSGRVTMKDALTTPENKP
jgi:hypothetical protein